MYDGPEEIRALKLSALELVIASLDRKLKANQTNPLFVQIYETERAIIKGWRHHISTAQYNPMEGIKLIEKETRNTK